MVEHRLIERVIALAGHGVESIESTGEVDSVFIDTVVDFIRTYADRTHHGKEEDILFRELGKRELSANDLEVMTGLVEDHAAARAATGALAEANERYRKGDKSALADIGEKLKFLVGLYPNHIEKEDKVFFPAARTYFTDEEDRAMLAEFWEFDRKMIHEKYEAVVKRLEAARG